MRLDQHYYLTFVRETKNRSRIALVDNDLGRIQKARDRGYLTIHIGKNGVDLAAFLPVESLRKMAVEATVLAPVKSPKKGPKKGVQAAALVDSP